MDKLFEQASKFINIEGLKTRKEVIERVKSTSIYFLSDIFEYMTESEKEEYFIYIKGRKFGEFIKSKRVEDIIRITKDIKDLNDANLSVICHALNTSKDKEAFVDEFFLKLSSYAIYRIIEYLNNDTEKERFIKKYITDKYYYILCLKTLSDETKEKYIEVFTNISDRVELILSFKDKELIKKYAKLPDYSNYRSTLVASTKDNEFIKSMFLDIEVEAFRINLLNKISDNELKLELINLINDDAVKSFVFSNYALIEENITLSGTKIDEDITIGVELECSNKEIKKFKKTKTIFSDYKIKKDSSVKDGFEIVSPILHYNVSDMSKLKSVCDLLNKCNFYTDYTSGGHIHIGSSYLTRKEDFNMLLYLYINTEDILYFISDRENSIKRIRVNQYASKTKKNYIKAIDKGMFSSINDDPIKNTFNLINNDRYKGLNFQNLDNPYKDTIEFRMPNGEINFNELMLNIKLFSRLIEISHKINDLSNDDIIKVKTMELCELESETSRLNILLDILFTSEEEKELYRRRYYTNKKLYLKNIRNLIDNALSKNDSVRIENDSKCLTRNVN